MTMIDTPRAKPRKAKPVTSQEPADGQLQGATVRREGVAYRVYAPACRKVELEIMGGAGAVLRRVPMRLDDEGFAMAVDSEGKVGDLYKYRLDEGSSWPDPASRFQPAGVHGPSMVVDSRSYQWQEETSRVPSFRDLVIYELHVGTFTREGTFRSAIERLQFIKELGANAIEIMPVGEFPGNWNWGYDGVYLYAPSRAYGTPDDLRALVDAAHRLGLAVILDVVYNHFGPDGNYMGKYIGHYLNESAKTPWGGAIRYGEPEFRGLRELVVANPTYWMREFRIDGFRLDATHAIVDASARHILAELTAAIHAHGGFAIAEDSRNNSRLLLPEELGGYGFDGVWADDLHHTVRVANTREKESYFGEFDGSLAELLETLRNGWFYRGQALRTRARERGTECRHIPPQKFVHCISNHDQVGNSAFGERLSASISPEAYRAASALLCLSPYTPMLFMGQEWASSTPFLFFTDHQAELGKLVTAGRREEFRAFEAFQNPETRARIPDPQAAETFQRSKLAWEEVSEGTHAATLALYRECLHLRGLERAFRPSTRALWEVQEVGDGIGAVRLEDPAGDWLVLFDLLGGHVASLGPEAIAKLPPGQKWGPILSSNDARFGGTRGSSFDRRTGAVRFGDPELLLLRAGTSA